MNPKTQPQDSTCESLLKNIMLNFDEQENNKQQINLIVGRQKDSEDKNLVNQVIRN